ncbi:MAG: PEP-CTERM sorting domain-containing protein [Deltaproteobacteria bacterium]|nr:MAG: PEP-CTERM sorting domain-containing protein [Deltaproteobacteria bacterium]
MKRSTILAMACAVLFLPGLALADSVNFGGAVTAENTGGTTTITFGFGFVLNLGSGASDPVIGASVEIAQLTVGSQLSADTYTLLPTLAPDGFVLYKAGAAGLDGVLGTADDGIILRADLSPGLLKLGSSTVGISDEIALGLTDIEIDTTFGSAALASFVAPGIPGGDITVSLQFAGTPSMAEIIATPGQSKNTTYSGSVTPLPEPGTLLLFGSGLLGTVGLIRRRQRK